MALAPDSSGSSAATTAPAAAPSSGDAAGGRRAFPRQFWLLAAGFLILLTGVDMCFPFETIYLHDRLGASMTTIGLLLGVPLLAAMPFYVVDGIITDRWGRKPAMMAGIACATLLYLTYAFAGSLWQIGVAVALEAAFGWALFLTGSNAMVADLVAVERRAEAYGITRAAMHVGMVAGPLLAAAILARWDSYRTLFLGGAAICLAFVVIVAVWFRETRPPEARVVESVVATAAGYAVVLRDRRFVAFCAVALLPLYGFGQIWWILPVMLGNVHGVSPGTWGYLIAFYALCVAVFQYPVIRWSRRADEVLLMAVASLLTGVGLGAAVLVPWGGATFACVFVLALGVMFLMPVSSAVAAALAPAALRGRYMGAWTLVQMGGYAFGPILGGVAMDRLGARGAALVIVGCGVLGAVLYVLLSRQLRAAGDRMREVAGGAGEPGIAAGGRGAPPPV